MANEEHLKILREGVAAWNEWREKNPGLHPDLGGADLEGAFLVGASLSCVNLDYANLGYALLGYASLVEANLDGAFLDGASLEKAELGQAHLGGAHLDGAVLLEAYLGEAFLEKAELRGVDLHRADLVGANLRGAHLEGAILYGANLSGTDLGGAHLEGADLSTARLIDTDLHDAVLIGCRIYGTSVWDIKVNERTEQQNLIITHHGDPVITVDNIKVAQFVYLLLNNQEIRNVIETITSKAVLILGTFQRSGKPFWMPSGMSCESIITFRLCSTFSLQRTRRQSKRLRSWLVCAGSLSRTLPTPGVC
jgi:uncharacterized protein YjbI with pentapeptide repeats